MKWSSESNVFKQRFIPSLAQDEGINLMKMFANMQQLICICNHIARVHMSYVCPASGSGQSVKLSNW